MTLDTINVKVISRKLSRHIIICDMVLSCRGIVFSFYISSIYLLYDDTMYHVYVQTVLIYVALFYVK